MSGLLFLLLNTVAFCTGTIVLPANKTSSTNDVGIIFVQGASIPARNYVKVFQELQSKFDGNLWIALTEFPFDIPQPLMINSRINDGFTQLKKSGFQFNKDTPFFFVAHSLGGVFLQDYIFDKKNQDSLPAKVAGLILEGSYILRKNRDLVYNNSNLIPSIMSVSGDLDGLNRISRMSEAFYFDVQNSGKGVPTITYFIPGMNHYQFAGEGNPPFTVRSNDIKPEITNDEAKDLVASLISSHMKSVLTIANENDKKLLENTLGKTKEIAQPMIEAFLLEGSYHFNTPCYQFDKPEGTGCTEGSQWSEYSQKLMGTLNVNAQVIDSFHPVYQINPVHLPAIHNNCSTPDNCVLNITTVSEPIYGYLDSQDISLNPCAASEIKTKMMSRQSIFLAAKGKVYPLEETDGGNICAEINQESINWAKSKVPAQSLKRYLESKKQLRVGDDKGPYNAGPLWIWTYLEYNNKIDENGNSYVELRSPMMYTPYDYPIPLARSFHYCKVLSPARAVEWIYVDSLKP